jgi:hypothetical protein
VRAQGLLITALDVAAGCPRGNDVGADCRGRRSGGLVTYPFATLLQAGTLFAVLAPVSLSRVRMDAGGGGGGGGGFALDSNLPRYFGDTAPAYEERIEAQKANLFKGLARGSTLIAQAPKTVYLQQWPRHRRSGCVGVASVQARAYCAPQEGDRQTPPPCKIPYTASSQTPLPMMTIARETPCH